jgi:hypothetical protein
MKYYKNQSNPLKEVKPQPGSYVYDEYGNLVAFDLMGNGEIIAKTVLNDDIKLTEFEKPEVALHGFWALSTNELIKSKHGIVF